MHASDAEPRHRAEHHEGHHHGEHHEPRHEAGHEVRHERQVDQHHAAVAVDDAAAPALSARDVCLDYPDGTRALELDRIAEVSRAISAALDEHDPVPGPPYDLEVSSPGATRELMAPRHWARNVGRLVRVRPVAGERFTARLLEAHEDHAVVQRWHQPKKGMPVKYLEPQRLDFADVRGARVEVEG